MGIQVTPPPNTASGDVSGPGSSTDNAVVRFDGTSGSDIQNSQVIVDDSGNITTPGTTVILSSGSSDSTIKTKDSSLLTKSLNINSGVSSTNKSGDVIAASGNSADNSGNVGIFTGNSTLADSGAIFVATGTSGTGTPRFSGNINLTSGATTVSNSTSGNINLASGDCLFAGGISGNVVLSIGAAVGTRGKIKLKDGSEGTVGHVWTSTNADGSGHWEAAGSGGASTDLSNLTPTAINESLIPANTYEISLGDNTHAYIEAHVGMLKDTGGSGVLSVDVDSRTLNRSNGDVVVDWQNEVCYDSNAVKSLDFGLAGGGLSRSLFDEGGNQVAKWRSNKQLDLVGNNIVGVADPVNPQDAATKAYVDSQSAGSSVTVARAVWDATTEGDVDVSNPGTDTIDGVTLVTGDILLVLNQSDPTEGGPWTFDTTSTPFTRPAGWEDSTVVPAGTEVHITATDDPITMPNRFQNTTFQLRADVTVGPDELFFDINGFGDRTLSAGNAGGVNNGKTILNVQSYDSDPWALTFTRIDHPNNNALSMYNSSPSNSGGGGLTIAIGNGSGGGQTTLLQADKNAFEISGVPLSANGNAIKNALSLSTLTFGSPPAVAADPGAGTGATASLDTGSTDLAGQISVTTGAVGVTTGEQVTLTYDISFPNNSRVILTAADSNAALAEATLGVYKTSGASSFTINVNVALTAASTYTWDYIVVGC